MREVRVAGEWVAGFRESFELRQRDKMVDAGEIDARIAHHLRLVALGVDDFVLGLPFELQAVAVGIQGRNRHGNVGVLDQGGVGVDADGRDRNVIQGDVQIDFRGRRGGAVDSEIKMKWNAAAISVVKIGGQAKSENLGSRDRGCQLRRREKIAHLDDRGAAEPARRVIGLASHRVGPGANLKLPVARLESPESQGLCGLQ